MIREKTWRKLATIMFKKQQFLFAEKVALVGTQWSSSIFPSEYSHEGNDKLQ